MQLGASVRLQLAMVLMPLLICVSACGTRRLVLLSESCPKANLTMIIAEETSLSCGKEACLVIEVTVNGRRRELHRQRDWHVRFAEVYWLPNCSAIVGVHSGFGQEELLAYEPAEGGLHRATKEVAEFYEHLRVKYNLAADLDIVSWMGTNDAASLFLPNRRRALEGAK